MEKVSGVVEKVFNSKEFNTRYGVKKNIDFYVNNTKYTIKFHPVDSKSPVKKGDTVQFAYVSETNGQYTNNSVDKKSLVIHDANPEVVHQSVIKKDDYSTRAAKGQALNLAVSIAIAEKKHMDDNYILAQVDRFLELGEKVQIGNMEEDKPETDIETFE